MALPAHLQKYDGLLDIFVDALVDELLLDARVKSPIEGHDSSTGVNRFNLNTNTQPDSPQQEQNRCREMYPKTQP